MNNDAGGAPASNDGLGVAPKRASLRNRLRLFPGERWLMLMVFAAGVVATAGTRNWAGFGWCLTGACWWLYSCALEDMPGDDA